MERMQTEAAIIRLKKLCDQKLAVQGESEAWYGSARQVPMSVQS
jgi:hypothetical protein